MKYHAGILHGWPDWSDRFQVLILAHTPGIPLEWIYAALDLGWRRRRKLRALIASSVNGDFLEAGRSNADSVEDGDGWKMLKVVCPDYSGPVPLWSQLELQNDRRTDAAIAKLLGVDRKKVWRWRTNTVFDPLTLTRKIPNRGVLID